MFQEQIQVFDDVVPEFLQDYLYASIFGKIREDQIYPIIDFKIKYELTAEENGVVPISFTHTLKSSNTLSPNLANFSLIPIKVCERLNIYLKDIIVGRVFLTMPYNSGLPHARPHTDRAIPHWVVLYYVNDADGDTVFFDRQGKEFQRVTPKKGRVVFFNGNIMHGGGIPKNYPRCVVNFNILI
jgi:hypothetical protein